MAKRTAGAGSIYRLGNGTWRALATVGGGKRISHTAKTQREANEWLKETLRQLDHGMTIYGAKTPFADVILAWLAVKENKLRPATIEQYRMQINKRLIPAFGNLMIKELNAARIQGLYTTLQDQGTGARTIEICHGILHGCLKYAHRLGLIAQNWAELVESPRPEKKEMQIWSESQVSAFLAGAPDQAFYRLAFATGMRRGELVAVQWSDLDWGTGALMVRRQVYQKPGGGWRFQEPKTARGRRTIRIGPGLLEALRSQYFEVLPLQRELTGEVRWKEHDLIFPSTVGTPRNSANVSHTFKALVLASGLPAMRFHDIRHTAASLMLLHGEAPIRVAAILGQSLAILLGTYAHFLPTDTQESVSALMDSITTPTQIQVSRTDRARKNENAS